MTTSNCWVPISHRPYSTRSRRHTGHLADQAPGHRAIRRYSASSKRRTAPESNQAHWEFGGVLRTVRRTKTGPRRDVITVVDQPLLGTGAHPRGQTCLPIHLEYAALTGTEVVKTYGWHHDCTPGGYEIAAEPRNDRGAQLARP